MTADEMYSLLKFIIRKNQNGNLTPQDFDLIANRASCSYMDYLLGSFQKYLPGRPMAPATFGQNEDIRQRLTPFITTPVPLTINGSTGVAPYPDDFQADDAMYYGQYNRRVKYIQQDRVDSFVNSVINPIDKFPCYLLVRDGFQFYPATLGTAKLSYVRTPKTIKWNYTTDLYGRPIYNPIGSQDPEWYDLDAMQVVTRALAMLGVNLQLNIVEQYSQMLKNQGD